jgi:hypothetical protein
MSPVLSGISNAIISNVIIGIVVVSKNHPSSVAQEIKKVLEKTLAYLEQRLESRVPSLKLPLMFR